MVTLGSLFGGTFLATRGGGKQQQQQQQQGPPVSASSKDEEKFIQYVLPALPMRCRDMWPGRGMLTAFRDFLNSAGGSGEQKSAH